MDRFHKRLVAVIGVAISLPLAFGQKAPATPDKPWQAAAGEMPGAPPRSVAAFVPDAAKVYSLAELVNVAEHNNPETRVAWENAKARAADLGVSKSSLYPTLTALAL